MIVTKNRPRSVVATPEPKEAKATRKAGTNKPVANAVTSANIVTSANAVTAAIAPAAAPVHGIVMGVLAGFDSAMQAQVEFDGNPAPGALPALLLAPLGHADIGKAVALQFERGDLMRPVVIGLLYSSASTQAMQALGQGQIPAQSLAPEQNDAQAMATEASPQVLQISQDGGDVTLTAYGRLTLQCGRASLTLDVNGDIELRGRDVLSRAAGQNRIKGSSISLN